MNPQTAAVTVALGIAMALQAAILSHLAQKLHPLGISLAIQAAGVMVGLLWATFFRMWSAVWLVTSEWWWLLPLGILSWGIVAALGFSAARTGISVTLGIVVATQLTAGLILDNAMGRVEISIRQPIGIALLVAGLTLVSIRAREAQPRDLPTCEYLP